MFSDRDLRLPPLLRSQKQRPSRDLPLQKAFVQEENGTGADFSVNTRRKLLSTGSSYLYAGPGRKPQLLMQLESYVKKELQAISTHLPHFQEMKLEVYRNVFSRVINAFTTYQPLLSAIKTEYENTLAYQQKVIRDLEPLRSQLRLVAEECDRKIQARREEEQAEAELLKREKQELLRDIKASREREEATQAVVDHLQSELSSVYLQFRKERDAHRLLIWELNEMKGGSVKTEISADRSSEDSVELKLALKVCQEDLTKTQEQLTRMKVAYWDVVPRRDWDTLEEAQKLTQLQLETLQEDFHHLLELHKRSVVQTKTNVSAAVQTDGDAPRGQSQIQLDPKQEQINFDDVSESRTAASALESREAVTTAEEADEHVTVGQSKADVSGDVFFSETPT
ncbi:translin-associated factor X-interacting protein 1 isoform X1 [Fundulus heteroclitus]|uniref:translin-associated factor X-interacting protein 1 isoform X1 n=2 Tax=Fundulus heteroclitus TaxID=8078 RepID=UPI00165ACBD2|nr:translin-associated factor X-interacting protein 1 isoform X1 [Fundulus heteroclitus]